MSLSLGLSSILWHAALLSPQQEGGIGEGHRNPVTREGAGADSAADNTFLRALSVLPTDQRLGRQRGVSGERRWGPCSEEQRQQWAQHSSRELVEGDAAARNHTGEEFIYTYNGLAITSRFGCQCRVTAGCHGEGFIQQNSWWQSLRPYVIGGSKRSWACRAGVGQLLLHARHADPMLPLRWWPHSQVLQPWPGNVWRQAGLSLGV